MKRKITLCILLILIIMCVTLLSYEKINKTKVSNDTGMFAIFLEEEKDSGKYQKSNLKTWPTEEEYTINMLKSYCENGSILRWNNVDKKISLKVNGTDKCYVYFDKAEIGSAKHPHLIQTIEDLVRLSNDVNNGTTYAGEYFLLTNDLDFNDPSDYENPESMEFGNINGINGDEALIKELTTGSGFVPIGEYRNNSFKGNILGNNHAIKNLYISRNAISVGFIGWGTSFKISDLTITGTIDSRANEDSAGLVARADGINVIENVVSYLTVNSIVTLGGFIGSNGGGANTTIINCENKGTLNNNQGFLGGFVAWSNGKLTIENSHNFADITCNNSECRIGGLLGADASSNNVTKITNSSNNGNIETSINNIDVSYGYIGGLIGQIIGNVTIDNSYNSANVKNELQEADETNSFYIGGLIGYIHSNSEKEITISNSYNSGEIENGYYTGGLIGYVYEIPGPIIITNAYNTESITSSTNKYVSSFVGMVKTSLIYVLNSYNTGTLNGIDVGGLVRGSYASNIYLINCFNTGKINATDYASSLVMSSAWNGKDRNYIYLNNLYNIGEYSDISYNYGIGWLNQATGNILNTYYLNNMTALGGELTTGGTPMAINDMEKQEFVDILNQNIESINLEEIDEALKDYKLSKWELGKNGYPTLVNE